MSNQNVESGLHGATASVTKDEFKTLALFVRGGPVISDELKDKYRGHFVAFSLLDDLPQWQDKGAAKTRRELSEQMLPLICGKDYYAHAIE